MNLKYLILVGIGGSNLGAKAVYEALRKPDQSPEMLFADTVSPRMREEILAKLKNAKKEEIVLNYVSKSGATMESKENFEFFKEYAGTIVDTYKELDFDKTIGGRFSVLTEVGLYPLRMCGFDTDAMLEGAKEANLPAQAGDAAKLICDHMQKGFVIHNSFFFNPELEGLGKWHRQLMAESLGKEGKGILPIVSIGSADLHSVGQLYFGGPKNIFTEFIAPVGSTTLMQAIYEGTKTAYRDHGMLFTEFVLDKLDERSLGRYLQLKMLTIVELAKLMGVDPYNQPDVEAYKARTREILTSE